MRLIHKTSVALLSAAGCVAFAGVASADVMFTDSFDGYADGDFTGGGDWTTAISTGGASMGSVQGTGIFWGNPLGGEAALEREYVDLLLAGDTITMDANVDRGAGYDYGMRIILWDGVNPGSRVEVAGGTQGGVGPAGGADYDLTQVSYTVTAADILAGLDSVVFKYSHDGNWAETKEVNFAVTNIPEPGSLALLGLGGLLVARRRRG